MHTDMRPQTPPSPPACAGTHRRCVCWGGVGAGRKGPEQWEGEGKGKSCREEAFLAP